MGDVFIEHMIKRKTTSKILAMQILLWAGGIILAFLPILVFIFTGTDAMILLPVTFAGGFWGVYLLRRFLSLEFEYILTNGELDVDKIMGKNTRKRLISINCRDFEVLAPYKPAYTRDYENSSIAKVIDASGFEPEKRQFAVFKKSGMRTMLIFEPNERMMEAFRGYIRSKIKQ